MTDITTHYNQSMQQSGAASGGVIVWGIFSCHTLCPLLPAEEHLHATQFNTKASHERTELIELFSVEDFVILLLLHCIN